MCPLLFPQRRYVLAPGGNQIEEVARESEQLLWYCQLCCECRRCNNEKDGCFKGKWTWPVKAEDEPSLWPEVHDYVRVLSHLSPLCSAINTTRKRCQLRLNMESELEKQTVLRESQALVTKVLREVFISLEMERTHLAHDGGEERGAEDAGEEGSMYRFFVRKEVLRRERIAQTRRQPLCGSCAPPYWAGLYCPVCHISYEETDYDVKVCLVGEKRREEHRLLAIA